MARALPAVGLYTDEVRAYLQAVEAGTPGVPPSSRSRPRGLVRRIHFCGLLTPCTDRQALEGDMETTFALCGRAGNAGRLAKTPLRLPVVLRTLLADETLAKNIHGFIELLYCTSPEDWAAEELDGGPAGTLETNGAFSIHGHLARRGFALVSPSCLG
eukprot:s2610_g5.t2